LDNKILFLVSFFFDPLVFFTFDAQVLRMYSSFLLDIVNEADKANTLRIRADEIDELRSSSSSASAEAASDLSSSSANGSETNTDLLSDHLAVISIRSSRDRAGEILSLNTAALRILGYGSQMDMMSRI
jgi:hypothetical protein